MRFFAGYIVRNFSTSDDPKSALIGAFVVFGTGFMARPPGAMVIGLYGDRRGCVAALTLSIGTKGARTRPPTVGWIPDPDAASSGLVQAMPIPRS
ncbi:hypothetical protein [Streptomyces sp. NPDC057557]|uniref:hypothetical protein n=1 Tax=Streptomyces sp. NPDC057557 TaxID=3346167 RepID=UPI00367DF644